MSQRRPILVASSGAVLVAILGGLASMPGPWYAALNKSALTPPDWVFAPTWTVIYATCVVCAVMGWRHAETSAQRTWLIWLFVANGALNVLWSVLFFTLKRPDWALVEVAALWLSVGALIFFLRKLSNLAALLLIPYLIWVSFAAYLNVQVTVLNGPFS